MNTNLTVYAGFLGSGKTTEICRVLTEELDRQAAKLLLICEEGEEMFSPDLLRATGTLAEEILSPEALLDRLSGDLSAFALVIVELNGMWSLKELQAMHPARIVTVADCDTFFLYYANLRQRMSEQLTWADAICLTHLERADAEKQGRMEKLIHSMNGRARLFSLSEGGTPVPAGLGSSIDCAAGVLLRVPPDDYAYWYQELFANPEKYEGVTVELLCQNIYSPSVPEPWYYAGRYIMTCCEQDLQFWGTIVTCRAARPENCGWELLRAEICVEYNDVYGRVWPVLHWLDAAPAAEPIIPYLLP